MREGGQRLQERVGWSDGESIQGRESGGWSGLPWACGEGAWTGMPTMEGQMVVDFWEQMAFKHYRLPLIQLNFKSIKIGHVFMSSP